MVVRPAVVEPQMVLHEARRRDEIVGENSTSGAVVSAIPRFHAAARPARGIRTSRTGSRSATASTPRRAASQDRGSCHPSTSTASRSGARTVWSASAWTIASGVSSCSATTAAILGTRVQAGG